MLPPHLAELREEHLLLGDEHGAGRHAVRLQGGGFQDGDLVRLGQPLELRDGLGEADAEVQDVVQEVHVVVHGESGAGAPRGRLSGFSLRQRHHRVLVGGAEVGQLKALFLARQPVLFHVRRKLLAPHVLKRHALGGGRGREVIIAS